MKYNSPRTGINCKPYTYINVCVCVDICCYVLVRREVYVLLLLTVIHTHRHTHLRVSWLWIVELCESKGCSSLPDDTMRSFCFYGVSEVVSFRGVRVCWSVEELKKNVSFRFDFAYVDENFLFNAFRRRDQNCYRRGYECECCWYVCRLLFLSGEENWKPSPICSSCVVFEIFFYPYERKY